MKEIPRVLSWRLIFFSPPFECMDLIKTPAAL